MKNALIEPLETRIAPAVVIGVTGPNPVAENAGGNGLDTTVIFTISLSEAGTDVITVDCNTLAGSATEPSDYDGFHSTVTFNPGETSKEVSVTIHDDQQHEGDESFSLVLSNPTGTGTSLGTSAATAVINDNDPVPTLSVSNVTQAEGNSNNTLSFVLRLSSPSSEPITLQVATQDGSAISGQDYDAISQEITIPVGQTEYTVSINIRGDTDVEESESFNLLLSNPQNVVLDTTTASATLTNDDSSGVPVASITSSTATEGPNATLVFTVTLSEAPAGTVSILYSTGDVSAKAGLDYTAISNGTVTFGAGETTKTITVNLLNDNIYELPETFNLTLSTPSGATLDPDHTSAIGTIDDDDKPTVSFTGFGQTGPNLKIAEGNAGLQQYLLGVTLSNPTSVPLTINLASANGTATAGTDYLAISQSITFAPGELTKSLPVIIKGDTDLESDEVFTITASGTDLAASPAASVTLLNDERNITVGDVTITEANGDTEMVFTVTLDAPSSAAAPVSLDYISADGTAVSTGTNPDFVAKNLTTLTFADGEIQKEIRITIKGDTKGEPDEFFKLNFSNVQNALINKTSVTGTILDDDPYISISDTSVIEGATGTQTNAVFTVTVLRAGNTDAIPVKLAYSTANGSSNPAIGGTSFTSNAGSVDYLIKTGTLVFGTGQTSKTISIPVQGDNLNETDELFTVNLSFATDNASPITSDSFNKSVGTATIVDDEGLISISDATIVEGNSGTSMMAFVVSVANRSSESGSITVSYTTKDGTAVSSGLVRDFTATSGSLTFGSGVSQQTILVPIIGDLLKEGTQTFTVELSSPTNGSLGKAVATGTILDNDTAATALTIAGGSVLEGDATTTAQLPFTVSLTGGGEVPISVTFSTKDDSTAAGAASVGTDYEATTKILIFYPGDATQTALVQIFGDNTAEVNETVIGQLSNPTSGTTLTKTSASGTIIDDDITATISGVTVVEGDTGTKTGKLTVTLSDKPLVGQDIVVGFGITGGTATAGVDYNLVTTSPLTFKASDFTGTGPFTKEITFSIIGDTLNEVAETVFVSLNSISSGKIGAPSQGILTITDNDTVAASIADLSVLEGDTGTKTVTFTVTLNRPSQQSVSVIASTLDGTALAVTDYISVQNQTITFAPGETSKTFSVNIVGDDKDEATESFFAKLTLPSGSTTTLARDTATATILDNDARSISIADSRVYEGKNGTTMMDFTVTLSAAAQQVISVSYNTADDTGTNAVRATAGEDYIAQSGTLTFAVGETSKTISVVVNGDGTVEPDETFLVRLSNPVNGTIKTGTATGRIVADESYFQLNASGATLSVAEDDPANNRTNSVTFEVTRGGDLTKPGSVTYTTADNTTTSTGAFADYVAKSGVLSFPAGVATQSVTITLKADANYEADETFYLRLTDSTGGYLAANDVDQTPQTSLQQIATIQNNDARPTVTVTDASVKEGALSTNATMTFTVTLSAADFLDVITLDAMTQAITGQARAAASFPFPQDFTPIAASPAAPKITFAKGETTKTFTVTVLGDNVDENDETFGVVFSDPKAGTEALRFTGDTATTPATSKTVTGTILDDDAAPTLRFGQVTGGTSNGDLTVLEGFSDSVVKPGVVLSTFSEKEVTVKLTVVEGTAKLGTDFQAPNGNTVTLTFAPGSTDPTVAPEITILGDSINEADETFTVVLSDATNATITDDAAKITISNDDALPQLAINGASLVEGDDGTSEMVFTVSLLGASDRAVTVNFATAEGTAKSSGPLPDFIAKTGTLTFAPGETNKTISVSVIGDTYAEADETFTVTLSGASNATPLTNSSVGTGTILNGDDSIIGLIVQDASKVEGNSSSSTNSLSFVVEATKAPTSNITFTATTRNGTAIGGTLVSNVPTGDFNSVNTTFTLSANSSSTTVAVTIFGDTTFESTESMFLGISNASGGAVIASAEGRGTIFNDDLLVVSSQMIKYVDEDGDLATVKITKGNLLNGVLTFGDVNAIGGRILQLINFTGAPASFSGTSLSVTAEAQSGFAASGLTSDGMVDVGTIRGALVDSNTLQFRLGVDFTNITVQGDVSKITAGDNFVNPSISGVLSLGSLGLRGTATQHTSDAVTPSLVDTDSISSFLSAINSFKVAGDVTGTVRVLGNQFGKINALNIGGALKGTSTTNSGLILFTGSIGTAVIGSIEGGDPDASDTAKNARNSGSIIGSTDLGASIGSLKILGNIEGGSGQESGRVVATRIGALSIGGDIIGGTGSGNDSGSVFALSSLGPVKVGGDVRGGSAVRSGVISSGGPTTSVTIGGSLIGGSADDAGELIFDKSITTLSIQGNVQGGTGVRTGVARSLGSIGTLTVGIAGALSADHGNIIGGTGKNSGFIAAGTGTSNGSLVTSGGNIGNALVYGDIVGSTGTVSGGVFLGGVLTKLEVKGNIIGGDAFTVGSDPATTSVLQSGFVNAGRITQMILGGDLRTGTVTGAGIADSGTIRSQTDIGSLTIKGSVIGSAAAHAVIAAGANGLDAKKNITPSIASLTILGDASYLDVVAGYVGIGSSANPLGTPNNPDAQIGTVTFKQNILATNVVAGSLPGVDLRFGTSDDTKISSTADNAKVISSIAKVVIGGTVLPNSDDFGIVAQRVGAVIVGTRTVDLNAGADNDPVQEIEAGTRMRVNEVSI